MLSVFRSNTNNWLMIGVFIAITFVFVFTFGSWGGGNVSGELPVAATVNGQTIPMSQFRVQYAQTFRTQTMFRPGFTADKAREEGLDQQVLDRLITNELLAQAAVAHGLVVDDGELAQTIAYAGNPRRHPARFRTRLEGQLRAEKRQGRPRVSQG